MSAFSTDTVGDWVEYQHADVVSAIETLAGNPDIEPAQEYAKGARRSLDGLRATVVSILVTALEVREDPLVRENLDEAKAAVPYSQSDVVNFQRPSGTLMTRDMTALNEGLIAPPHTSYMAGVVAIIDPGRRSGELAKLSMRVAEHLDRSSAHDGDRDQRGSRVFIGHGGSPLWREFKDFLSDRLGLEWEEFNRVSPAGVGTTDRLSAMLDTASMAFLICTAEDEHADGTRHAVENVIHEAGLFQGRLGFNRAIVVLEEGCSEFSNIHGLGQIRFPAGHIEACFEEVRRVLEREGVISAS